MFTLKAAKALFAGAIAGLTALKLGLTDGMTGVEWTETAIAVLLAWQGTYWVDNQE